MPLMSRRMDDRDHENRLPNDTKNDAVWKSAWVNPSHAANLIANSRLQRILQKFIEAFLHRDREFRTQSRCSLIVPGCSSEDI